MSGIIFGQRHKGGWQTPVHSYLPKMLHVSTLKRRLKTLITEFERARHIWFELNDNGFTLANSLVKLRLQERKVEFPTCLISELDDSLDSMEEHGEENSNENTFSLSQSLQQVLEKMASQYAKMKMQILQIEFLLEEASESLGDEFVYNTPVYLTCTLETFVHHFVNIFNMFTQEIDLKNKIFSSLQDANREQAIVLLSTWLNQPYINDDKIKEFESICELELESEEKQ
ncbi:4116_t:CDS:2 [Acaulospora morrowiae]|uniref:4116_t:CDS:1 n=1 Tax=Acaulospora morrowiae TaxID=94023 RepID=A0A9N8W1V5_9GLOM|nr:4116_t:CDS:2 [Acaulospora morrowiae]